MVKLLIADDERFARDGLCFLVHDAYPGSEILAAEDGRQALAMLIKAQPDVAIIDIKMPLLDGLDVIRIAVETGIKTSFIILSRVCHINNLKRPKKIKKSINLQGKNLAFFSGLWYNINVGTYRCFGVILCLLNV